MKKKKKNLKKKDRVTRIAEMIYELEANGETLTKENIDKIEAVAANLSLDEMVEVDNLVQKMFKKSK